jgi:hypothetical protein
VGFDMPVGWGLRRWLVAAEGDEVLGSRLAAPRGGCVDGPGATTATPAGSLTPGGSPIPAPIVPLSVSALRARAAAAINAATDEVDLLTAATLADVLDAVSPGVLLRAAGLEDDEARIVLGVMWAERN